jgi:serine/threonine protein kinase
MAIEDKDDAPTQRIGTASTLPGERTPDKQSLHPGMMLGGRYLIEKELGRGGVGVVYLARDKQLLSRPVVIKVLLERQGQNQWFKKKFRQEIEALTRIDHPGVIGVLDAGEMSNGQLYFVMHYVEGITLRSVMKVEGMQLRQVANIMRQAGQALNVAHGKGVFHRDLKPENIMLQMLDEGEELVKLIDFGIALVKDSQVAPSDTETQVAGTFAYMAPEQLRGRPTASSDIYSMGVIAYEMVTGQLPFNPKSVVELYEMQQQGVKVKPKQNRHSLPEAAQEVILRALSFNQNDRYQRARDFGEALAQTLTADVNSPVLSRQSVHLTSPALANEAEPNLGPFVFKLCNRSRQVSEFTSFFTDNLKRQPGRPQIYLVRGEERECHDSLVERLVNTQVKRFAEKRWGEQRGVVIARKLGWPYEGESEELQQELRRMLFAEFDPVYMEDDVSVVALCNLNSLSLSPLIVIQHRIHASRWDRMTAALIEWYLTFWSDIVSKASTPQFLIFFNIIYPKESPPSWWKVILKAKQFDKERIERELQDICSHRSAGLPCLMLRELLPVKPDEVKDWFSLNNIHSEKARYELLERIFTTDDGRIAEHKSMADIEYELQRLVESIQQTFIRARGLT